VTAAAPRPSTMMPRKIAIQTARLTPVACRNDY
jgi:hypothetical protein